jgi:uncharacterized repeat protein (TIGR03803 family)
MKQDTGMTREFDGEVGSHIREIESRIAAQAAAHGESLETDVNASSEHSGLQSRGIGRREFMRGSAAVAGSVAVAGTLGLFHARKAHATNPSHYWGSSDYGEPVPTIDQTTGLPLIGLPPGFKYWSWGWTGDPIFPSHPTGPVTPALHDGMAVIKQVGPWAIVCRNHEVGTVGAGAAFVDGPLQYSPAAGGGNTNFIFDTLRREFVAAWPTLSGTIRNCAGGETGHASWLSCEETGVNSTGPDGTMYTHGWVFDVPAIGVSDAKPIKSMGRRSHEACAVDPRTGYVYLTEDTAPGGIYRYKPHRTSRWQRPYSNGGTLEMLKIEGMPNANLRGSNPQGGGGTPYPVALGAPLDIEWVPIHDPENLVNPSNFAQGGAQGGADFRRPEGAWYGDGNIYFVSTDGGSTGNGQVFSIDIRRQTLTLIYDAPVDANGMPSELDNPDNLTVTPRGGLLFCEDNSGNPAYIQDGFSTERMVGMGRDGRIFTFATNLVNFAAPYTRPGNSLVFSGNQRSNEWAGACFDRSGRWLFANIQTPGITFAITGPWHQGPL